MNVVVKVMLTRCAYVDTNFPCTFFSIKRC